MLTVLFCVNLTAFAIFVYSNCLLKRNNLINLLCTTCSAPQEMVQTKNRAKRRVNTGLAFST